MIKSMTGYGRAAQTIGGREITVEIRSVNNRYLDCSVKLPRVFGFAEDAVKSRVKEEISRGKVDVFISVNVTADAEMKISLNRPVLEGYLAALNTISKDYGVPNDVTVTSLARMPDVFVVEKQEEDEQQAANEELNRELASGDKTIIERAARDELGYARPNERVFVDVSGK